MNEKKRKSLSSHYKKRYYQRLLEEQRTVRVAPLFFTLLILITLNALLFSSSITGFASLGTPIDTKVVEVLDQKGTVDVLIELDTPSPLQASAQEKQRIRDAQRELRSLAASFPQSDLNIRHLFSTSNYVSATVSPQGLEALRKNPYVKSIEYDRPEHILLQTSTQFINATKVYTKLKNGVNLTGKHQSICVIDTGINYLHQDLGGSAFPNSKVIGGTDFVNADNDPFDDNGHGTHVAGIAAANGVLRGVAPDANIVAVKAFDVNGAGQTSTTIAAIEYCTQNKTLYNISVIVMSFGSGEFKRWNTVSDCLAENPSAESAALSAARAANITLVAASGNDPVDDGIQYPACHPDVISVGNSDYSDTRYSLSNVGDLLDIFAPGVNINSTSHTSATSYVSFTGTSMATPHVGGVAALIAQYESLQNNTPSQESILKALKSSTHTVTTAGRTFKRLDALEAINAVLDVNTSSRTISSPYAKVSFSADVDYSNSTAAFTFGPNLIIFNETFSAYNIPSNITFVSLPYNKRPVVYRNGVLCSSPSCNITSYSGGNLTFEVAGFSNYTSGPNARLEVWDQNDPDHEFLNITKGNNITFFANYTNVTSGLYISSAQCNISFADSFNKVMNYNATTKLFEYTRNFTLAGLYTYNVTCSDSNYESLNVSDLVDVLTSCATPPSGINWTIPENKTVTCNNDLITFSDQVLIMNANTTLILNFTKFNYSFPTAQTLINASNTSTVVLNNSVIEGANTAATLDIAGTAILENFTFNNTAISLTGTLHARNSNFYRASLQGSSQATIIDSTYSGDSVNRFETTSNAVLDADNITFDGELRLEGSSIARLNNSVIKNTLQLGGTAVLNATNTSIINTSIFTVAFNTDPVIDGFFTILATPSISALATLHRYYPIRINYTNGDPVSNAVINVTNSSGDLIEQTVSDVAGLAKIRLNFTSSTVSETFNVSVNPTITTLVNTTTPLVFTLATPDTIPPNVTLLLPLNNTITQNTSLNFTFNTSDDNQTDNCSIYLDAILNQTNTTLSNGVHNFTITGIDEGVHNWSVSCTDVNGNTNTSQTFFFTTDLTGPVVELLTINNAQFNTNTFNLSFNTTDALSSVVNCSLFINATLDQSDNTITQTVEQNFSVTRADGVYNWSVSCVDNATNKGLSVLRTFEVDATAPTFSNDVQNPLSSSTYTTGPWEFNITVSDAHIDTVILEINGTNYTGTINADNVTVLLPNLGAGSYVYTWYANDTFGNKNKTSSTYSILQAVPDLNLTLNGNYNDLSVTYGTLTTANATSTVITPSLLLNDSLVTNPHIATLAAGTYNYTATFAGNQNYSARNVSRILTVNRASSSCSLLLNPASPQVYTTALNASCSCTSPENSALLERNSTDVTSENNQLVVLAAGTYNYSCSVAQSQNYTAAQNQSFYTINRATPALAIASQPGTSFTYGVQSNVSCSANTNQVSPQFFLNGTAIASPHVTTLAAGSYNYTCNSSQTQNYTAHSVEQIITVSKATPSVTLQLSPSSSLITSSPPTNYYLETWGAQCSVTPSSLPVQLLINSTVVTTPYNDVLAAGTYNFTCRAAETQNYTSGQFEQLIVVEKLTPVLNLTLNGNAGDISTIENTNVTVWTNLSIPESLVLTRNGIIINSGIPPLENETNYTTAGTYVFNSSFAGNQNYSATSRSRILTVNSPAPPPSGGSGGGGSGGGSCIATWSCSEWSECSAGVQTRNCTQTNSCSNTKNKPVEIQNCVMPAVTREIGGSFIPTQTPSRTQRKSASCFDGVQNQDEEGVDCGGVCNKTCVPPGIQKPQPTTSCGDGVCSVDEMCSCLTDCRPGNEILLVIIILIASGLLGIARGFKHKKLHEKVSKPTKKRYSQKGKRVSAKNNSDDKIRSKRGQPTQKTQGTQTRKRQMQTAHKTPFSNNPLFSRLFGEKDPLKRYVQDQLRKGKSKEEIAMEMKQAGIRPERVEEVLK